MAMFHSNIPPSSLLKTKDLGGDEPQRQTKEQYRKMKELEEARKAGTVPAATDEEGRDINPHIPQYISQAPWYLGTSGPTLKHQRAHPEREKHFAEIYEVDNLRSKRGLIEGRGASKFRKGACENCGSMTHQKKDCFERPRKLAAKYTGEDIAPDEYIAPSLDVTYEAKRDRWAGYDPARHQAVVDEFEKLEEARRLIRADKITESVADEVVEGEDEDKYAEHADMPGVKVDADSRTRITVRNLRIREDTAKYLFNLDLESAHYDPKSRSMRDNPFKNSGKETDAVPFAGENFLRFSGEVVEVNQGQLFAWEAQRRGVDVHTLAEPTKLEALQKEYQERKDSFKTTMKSAILDKYGGEEHLQPVPRELLQAQTEHYVEYNRRGEIVKGEERPTFKSRFEEDVYPNNHSSVWGSFWTKGLWGYKCCHSTVKNSYCTGAIGIEANMLQGTKGPAMLPPRDGASAQQKTEGGRQSASSSSSSSDSSSSDNESSSDDDRCSEAKNSVASATKQQSQRDIEERRCRQQERKRKKRQKAKQLKRTRVVAPVGKSDDSTEDEDEEEVDPLRKALIDQARADRQVDACMKKDERDLPYNSRYDFKAPSEIDMEAFKIRKIHPSDPMAHFLNEKQ